MTYAGFTLDKFVAITQRGWIIAGLPDRLPSHGAEVWVWSMPNSARAPVEYDATDQEQLVQAYWTMMLTSV